MPNTYRTQFKGLYKKKRVSADRKHAFCLSKYKVRFPLVLMHVTAEISAMVILLRIVY